MAKKEKNCVTGFFSDKRVQAGIIILLVLIPLLLSVYFRSYPARLPIADQWAQASITNSVRNQVTSTVNQQYPNLPADRKNILIDEQVQQAIDTQKEQYDQVAKEQAGFIRERLQDENGQTYLLAIDPYYYLYRVENMVEKGMVCDAVIDGTCTDTRMWAPLGRATTNDYHSIIGATVYRIADLFGNPRSVLATFFWVPVLISALAVIPAFFLARRKAGNLGGFVAAVIVATHATFIGRTAAGFSDTDAYNVTMPLFIFWAFIEAFEAKDIKKKIIFASLTGLFTGIYSRLWQGWWYIFDFVLAVMIVYIAYTIIKSWLANKSFTLTTDVKHSGLTFLGVVAATGLFVILFRDLQTFLNAPLSPLRFTIIQNAAHANLWPNVFTTVAELNRASLSSIVTQIGGPIYFYLACLGIVITLIPLKNQQPKHWMLFGISAVIYLVLLTKPLLGGNPYLYLTLLLLPIIIGLWLLMKDKEGIDFKYAIFLTVWFVGTIYASTQGVRFVLLLVPAYAVALGIFIGQLYKLISDWATAQFKSEQLWLKAALVIIALLLLIRPITAAHQTALHEVPSMNDAWWDSLKKIDAQAAPNAIINSWWDFGHWFKAVAKRSVTFDGASQNTPMAHWVGLALTTNEEDRAVGILRMLDCGSRTGYDALAMEIQGTDNVDLIKPETTIVARDIIADIVVIKDRQEAKEVIKSHGLSDEAAEKVVALTHCEPPEDYFITSSDMIGKAGVWSHFGSWSFKRAYVYTVLSEEKPDEAIPAITELFNITPKDAGQLYYDAIALQTETDANAWISPWPNYITVQKATCSEENGTVTCPVGRAIGQQSGSQLVLDSVVVPLSQPNATTMLIKGYNPSTGRIVGEQTVQPVAVTIGDGEKLVRTVMAQPSISFEAFLTNHTGRYEAIVASPELAASMFTRLFYFDGAYTNHFEKFSDEYSPITGDRIIVWKVGWE